MRSASSAAGTVSGTYSASHFSGTFMRFSRGGGAGHALVIGSTPHGMYGAWPVSGGGRPAGRRSRRGARRPSKLLQEAQVVGPELADVVQGVGEHGDALGAHAEGEAAVHGRVVAAVAQHHRVDHP